MMETFFATCPRGLEEVLSHELQELGGQEIRSTPGGVECQGPFSLCYRLNLESRIASRILWRVGQGWYRDEEDLYRLASSLPWPEYFSVDCHIKVRIIAQHSPLKSLEFATLRVKDAICDRFVRATHARPEVSKRQPDIQIVVFVDEDHVVWYIDTSGDPLFKRGWRKVAGEAPIRENLAAGILRLSGWTGEQVLLDPMCGAGTFLIEAALIAKGIAPGSGREFAFRHLQNFDQTTWEQIRQESIKPISPVPGLSIFGYDEDANALAMARRNLEGLGLEDIQLNQVDVLDVTPPGPKGFLVTNPPYGVRMGDRLELEEWYPKFGNLLKQRFAGWDVYVLTADSRLPKLIHLAPSRKIPLFNGPLESRLYEFQMVAGGNRKSARQARHQTGNNPGLR
ncbi:MAG: THUMP domain-containing protein [Nitrospirota bacterium]|nr:THUMP domain-containing protein [Nitrospirota bacterium]MDH5699699.1 THUMP domain-containing protein [Nitrospirota bacterium]